VKNPESICKLNIIFLGFFLLALSGCAAHFYSHDPAMAGCTALNFTRFFIVKNNLSEAYLRMDPRLKAFSKQKLLAVAEKMHPDSRPNVLTPVIYQIYPGSNRIDIFILGSNKLNEFKYKVEMAGDANKGYKAGGIFRIQEFPSLSNLVLEGTPQHCKATD
jgi:hypothetical protein